MTPALIALLLLASPPPPKVERPCPEPARVCLTPDGVRFAEQPRFAFDKDHIRRESFVVLDELAVLIAAHPEWKLLEIRAHRADDGDEYPRAVELTERRARAVMAYLLDRGIPRERLRSKGYGSTQPLQPNTTPAGRAANRRIEVVIVE